MKYLKYTMGIITLVLFIGLYSCEKKTDTSKKLVDVSFTANNALLENIDKKNGDGGDPLPKCSDEAPAYVYIELQDPDGNVTPYTLDLLVGTETQVIKLLADVNYTIITFLVYDAGANLIWASPTDDSDLDKLYDLLDNVEVSFSPDPFTKNNVAVDVICFQEENYDDFGFRWFDYKVFEKKPLCFFGDICSKFWEDFDTYNPRINPYYDLVKGLDFHAIYRVELWNEAETELIDEATNYGATSIEELQTTMCLEYIDNLSVDENFVYKIYVYLPDGTDELVHTGIVNDDSWSDKNLGVNSFGGGDGIFDFVMGNCYDESATDVSLTLPPYLYLPEKGTIKITSGWHEGPEGYDYMDIILLGDSWNHELYPPELKENKYIQGWCGDLYHGIYLNKEYEVTLYSSLDPNIPDRYKNYPFDVMNWLINQPGMTPSPDLETAKRLQSIVWLTIHGDTEEVRNLIAAEGNPIDIDVRNEAANALLLGDGFEPQTGDWQVVIFDPHDDPEGDAKIQLVLVRVDP